MKERHALALTVAGGLAALALRSRRRRAHYSFEGRAVLITGGSRGLGLLLARELAAEGARLALLARDAEELRRAGDELRAGGADVLLVPCDVRSRRQIADAVAAAVERFGTIDVLINNAGVIQVGPLEHMTREDFEESMAVHFWAALDAVDAVMPHMRRRGEGRIVNIASFGGKIAVPHLLPYCAGKFALTGFSEGLRHELRRHGVLVTTVCPGLMRTGSHVQAAFKGQQKREFGWFALMASLPFASMDGERAARQIVEACRHGRAELIVSGPARAAVLASALAPELVAAGLDLVSLMLPGPAGPAGDEERSGRDSRSAWVPRLLTLLADRASRRNNEGAPA